VTTDGETDLAKGEGKRNLNKRRKISIRGVLDVNKKKKKTKRSWGRGKEGFYCEGFMIRKREISRRIPGLIHRRSTQKTYKGKKGGKGEEGNREKRRRL